MEKYFQITFNVLDIHNITLSFLHGEKTNLQTVEVNTNTFVWGFAEDYNSAVTTTEAGVINNWTRR